MSLTEVANKIRLLRVGSPFAVCDGVVIGDDETKLLITLGERVITSFVRLDISFPLCEQVVPRQDAGKERLEITIHFENGGGVELRYARDTGRGWA